MVHDVKDTTLSTALEICTLLFTTPHLHNYFYTYNRYTVTGYKYTS